MSNSNNNDGANRSVPDEDVRNDESKTFPSLPSSPSPSDDQARQDQQERMTQITTDVENLESKYSPVSDSQNQHGDDMKNQNSQENQDSNSYNSTNVTQADVHTAFMQLSSELSESQLDVENRLEVKLDDFRSSIIDLLDRRLNFGPQRDNFNADNSAKPSKEAQRPEESPVEGDGVRKPQNFEKGSLGSNPHIPDIRHHNGHMPQPQSQGYYQEGGLYVGNNTHYPTYSNPQNNAYFVPPNGAQTHHSNYTSANNMTTPKIDNINNSSIPHRQPPKPTPTNFNSPLGGIAGQSPNYSNPNLNFTVYSADEINQKSNSNMPYNANYNIDGYPRNKQVAPNTNLAFTPSGQFNNNAYHPVNISAQSRQNTSFAFSTGPSHTNSIDQSSSREILERDVRRLRNEATSKLFATQFKSDRVRVKPIDVIQGTIRDWKTTRLYNDASKFPKWRI